MALLTALPNRHGDDDRRPRAVGAAAAGALLLVAACASDGDAEVDETTSAAPDTTVVETTAAPDTTVPPSTEATTTAAPTTEPPATEPPTTQATTTAAPTTDAPPPISDVAVVLADSYRFDGSLPDPAELPVAPGAVTVRWYRTTTNVVAVYEGLDPDVATCPGNSVLTSVGCEFVSNAGLDETLCGALPTFIPSDASGGLQLCDGTVSYLTLIPADTPGRYFASIETPTPDGNGVGVTGSVLVEDPSSLPEIDPSTVSC